MRTLSTLLLATLLSVSACVPRLSVPATPVPSPQSQLPAAFMVTFDIVACADAAIDATSCVRPVPSAVIKLHTSPGIGADHYQSHTTNADGYTLFTVDSTLTATDIIITAAGFHELVIGTTVAQLTALPHNVLHLNPVFTRGPTWADTAYIGKCNFYGDQDDDHDGKLIFDIFYRSQNRDCLPDQHEAGECEAPGRDHWLDVKRRKGEDCVVLGPTSAYPNYWLTDTDDRDNPKLAVSFVREVVNRGFRVVWMASSGDGGTAADINQYWDGYEHELELAAIKPWVLPSNGFETYGPGAGWTSNDNARGFRYYRDHGWHGMLAEGQPERWTPSSHPIETDDPWQGDEIGAWKSGGGEFVTVNAYETPHGSKLLDPSNQWQDRWHEGVVRPGCGQRGWRRQVVWFFEVLPYDHYHGACGTQHQCEDTARRLNQVAIADALNTCGIQIGLGNWVPAR